MSKGVKIGIIVVAVIIVAVGAWLLIVRWGLGNDAASNNTNTTTTNTNTTSANGSATNTNGGASANTNTATEPAETRVVDDSAAVLRLARIVVERYGSYSNQNNFENITSLEPFMTQRFQKESAEFIAANQGASTTDDYYGISTTVLSLEATNLGDSTATVEVVTQRIESKGNDDPNKFNQTAVVTLEKVETNWKVDNITWK